MEHVIAHTWINPFLWYDSMNLLYGFLEIIFMEFVSSRVKIEWICFRFHSQVHGWWCAGLNIWVCSNSIHIKVWGWVHLIQKLIWIWYELLMLLFSLYHPFAGVVSIRQKKLFRITKKGHPRYGGMNTQSMPKRWNYLSLLSTYKLIQIWKSRKFYAKEEEHLTT